MTTSRLPLFLLLAMLASLPPLRGQAMPEPSHAKAAPSNQLQLTIGGKTWTIALADLDSLPQKTIKVHNEHTKKDETYSGVALSDLLAKYGFAVGQPNHRKMLHSYLAAEGTDKYWVLYSVTEIEGSEHEGDVLVATKIDGSPLGSDGELKLVASADKKPQRWVRNLSAIRLMTVTE